MTNFISEEERIRALPCWKGYVNVEPLKGGLSNQNFKVTDENKCYVARVVGGDVPIHSVMRFNELI